MRTIKLKDTAAAIAGLTMIVGAIAGVAMFGQERSQVTVVQSPTPVEIADLVAPTTTASPQATTQAQPEVLLQALPDNQTTSPAATYLDDEDEYESDDHAEHSNDDDHDEHGDDDDD